MHFEPSHSSIAGNIFTLLIAVSLGVAFVSMIFMFLEGIREFCREIEAYRNGRIYHDKTSTKNKQMHSSENKNQTGQTYHD